VLLDEFEKAHPDVHNVLLQILDEGRLTDGKGRTVNFRNAVIVMTSNLASETIREAEERGEDPSGYVQAVLRRSFRPEFVNRLDEVVVFKPLGSDAIREITSLQIARLRMLLAGRGLHLEVSEAAAARLAEEGYDPRFGARPLKRVIQRRVQDPLATELLEGALVPGDTVVADLDNGSEIVLRREPAGVAATGSS
jgi:ATP-dependent Clp protease ATP-binding subunit ClpB